MGQHKTNPTAIAAKKGELRPKPQRMPKRELERLLYPHAKAKIAKKTGLHRADLLMYVVKNKKKLNSVYGKSNF